MSAIYSRALLVADRCVKDPTVLISSGRSERRKCRKGRVWILWWCVSSLLLCQNSADAYEQVSVIRSLLVPSVRMRKGGLLLLIAERGKMLEGTSERVESTVVHVLSLLHRCIAGCLLCLPTPFFTFFVRLLISYQGYRSNDMGRKSERKQADPAPLAGSSKPSKEGTAPPKKRRSGGKNKPLIKDVVKAKSDKDNRKKEKKSKSAAGPAVDNEGHIPGLEEENEELAASRAYVCILHRYIT